MRPDPIVAAAAVMDGKKVRHGVPVVTVFCAGRGHRHRLGFYALLRPGGLLASAKDGVVTSAAWADTLSADWHTWVEFRCACFGRWVTDVSVRELDDAARSDAVEARLHVLTAQHGGHVFDVPSARR